MLCFTEHKQYNNMYYIIVIVRPTNFVYFILQAQRRTKMEK